jgi:hypothetical protein
VTERRIAFPIEFAVVDHHAFHRGSGVLSDSLAGAATVSLGTTTLFPYGSRRTLLDRNESLFLDRRARRRGNRKSVPPPGRGQTRANRNYVRFFAGSSEIVARRVCVITVSNKEQIDRRGVLGIDAEIDAVREAGGLLAESSFLPLHQRPSVGSSLHRCQRICGASSGTMASGLSAITRAV